ncbi:MAG: hypothetical protein J0I53_05875 [Chryseobacterium sp.]|nr:hypothetical protein [Chryseobacterium sp.]
MIDDLSDKRVQWKSFLIGRRLRRRPIKKIATENAVSGKAQDKAKDSRNGP